MADLPTPTTEYVLTYGIKRPGEDHYDCTIDAEEFLSTVAEWMDGRGVPCSVSAEITIVSMPRAKWERYPG